MFHISKIYYFNFDKFSYFLQNIPNPSEIVNKLVSAFTHRNAKLEFQVLGLIGKLLSGPWMTKFYSSARNQISTEDGIELVRRVISEIRSQLEDPIEIVHRRLDFLGNLLVIDNEMKDLTQVPSDYPLFTSMVRKCLDGILAVLERQYRRQFENEDKIVEARITSGRSHTMDAESIIGEFNALTRSSPNMNVLTASNMIKGKRNGIPQFLLDCTDSRLKRLIMLARHHSRKELEDNIVKKKQIQEEIANRIKKKKTTERED